MGTTNSSLAQALQQLLRISHFVGTGPLKNDSGVPANELFDKCYLFESTETKFHTADKSVPAAPGIPSKNRESSAFLLKIKPELDKNVLYRLSFHPCATTHSARSAFEGPLLNELAAIGKINEHSVILIDDPRLFRAPSPASHLLGAWPILHKILSALIKISRHHRITVIDGMICFYPQSIDQKVEDYVRHHRTDRLHLADTSRPPTYDLNQAEEKEALIIEFTDELKRLHEELRTQSLVMRFIKSPEWRKARRSVRKFIFKTSCPLGVLHQYAPRPLIPPPSRPSKTSASLPRFCIITPSYNQADFLERTIQSILNQHSATVRYGVQDGASTDNTIKIIAKYKDRLTYADSRPDQGQAHAVNFGFNSLKPQSDEIMGWVNSDDLLLPGTLDYVGAYFARHPNVDVVYGHRIIIDPQDREIGRWFLPRHSAKTLKWVDYVPQETLFWRATAWEKIGGLDASFQFALDWDFLLRLEAAGCAIVRLPRFLGCFRVHETQKTSSIMHDLGAREMAILRTRTHGANPSQAELRPHIQRERDQSALISRLYELGIYI